MNISQTALRLAIAWIASYAIASDAALIPLPQPQKTEQQDKKRAMEIVAIVKHIFKNPKAELPTFLTPTERAQVADLVDYYRIAPYFCLEGHRTLSSGNPNPLAISEIANHVQGFLGTSSAYRFVPCPDEHDEETEWHVTPHNILLVATKDQTIEDEDDNTASVGSVTTYDGTTGKKLWYEESEYLQLFSEPKITSSCSVASASTKKNPLFDTTVTIEDGTGEEVQKTFPAKRPGILSTLLWNDKVIFYDEESITDSPESMAHAVALYGIQQTLKTSGSVEQIDPIWRSLSIKHKLALRKLLGGSFIANLPIETTQTQAITSRKRKELTPST